MGKFIDAIINNNKNINEVCQKQEVSISQDNCASNFDDFDLDCGVFKIGIFGIGGAGCNMIGHIARKRKWDENVVITALNTDVGSLKSLKDSGCHKLFLLGKNKYRGAGSGGDPNIGQAAAEGDRDQIKEMIKDKDLVILLAGLGKGTGSGATPVIAEIAKELGICTIAIVNLPSIQAEGQLVYEKALTSFKNITKFTNSYSTISNDRIIDLDDDQLALSEAFKKANDEVASIVQAIVNIINIPTEINVDFADVRNFFLQSKSFMLTSFEMLNDGYSKDKLINKIATTLKSSYCNLNIQGSKSVIANIDLCNNTSKRISTDIKESFVEISRNDKLWFVNGINSHADDNKIKLDFLISSDQSEESCLSDSLNDQHLDTFITQVKEEVKSEYMTDEQFTRDISLAKESANGLKTNNGIVTGSIIGDDSLSITEHVTKQLSSDQCNDILTQALGDFNGKPTKEERNN